MSDKDLNQITFKTIETILLKAQSNFGNSEWNTHPSPLKPVIKFSDVKEIYIEVLNVVQHRIGISGFTDEELLGYVRQVFKVNQHEHDLCLFKASELKVPTLLLNVDIIEAKNLEAKDANGFSDPYCILGIITHGVTVDYSFEGDRLPISGFGTSPTRVSDISSGTSLMNRFKKSLKLKKKPKLSSLTKETRSIVGNIQTTSVKPMTLDPVWNENYLFKLVDETSEVLHIDIWDHDDEFSVFDAARKLNEIKGLRGLDRYFKQIAQSARVNITDKDANVDDFLGAVNIPLDDLSTKIVEKWYDLEDKYGKVDVSKKRQIKVKLSLGVQLSNSDSLTSRMEKYTKLVQFFLTHESLREVQESNEIKEILCQYSFYVNLSETHTLICELMAYEKTFIEYEYLTQKLIELDKHITEENIPTELIEILKECFIKLRNRCFEIISNLNNSLKDMRSCLKFLKQLYSSIVFKQCFPFENSFNYNLTELLKTYCDNWYDKKYSEIVNSDDSRVKGVIRFIKVFFDDCDSIGKNDLIEKETNIHFLDLFLKMLDVKIYHLIENTILCNTDHDSLELLELYALLNFGLLKWQSELISKDLLLELKLVNFHLLFQEIMNDWIDLFSKIFQREMNECLSGFNSVYYSWNETNDAKFLRINDKVAKLYEKLVELWKLLNWPNETSSILYANQLLESVFQVSLEYSAGLVQYGKEKTVFLTLDSIERIRELNKDFFSEIEVFVSLKSKLLNIQPLKETNIILVRQIENIIEILIDTEIDLKSSIFHLFESPIGSYSQIMVSQLTQCLNEKFPEYRENLKTKNFKRLLMLIWNKILDKIFVNLNESLKSQDFYFKLNDCLTILIDFFNADNEGLSRTSLVSSDKFKYIIKFIECSTIHTSKLIGKYFDNLILIQNSLNNSEYGKLTCQVYYVLTYKTLIIENIQCTGLKPMDNNGFSDPYIEIELIPKKIFPQVPKQSTKVHWKTLNPKYDERFEIELNENYLKNDDCFIQFTIMDQDIMWKNDFGGEAFVSLSSVPIYANNGPYSPSHDKNFFECSILHPRDHESIEWTILTMKEANDDEAEEFVKIRKDKL